MNFGKPEFLLTFPLKSQNTPSFHPPNPICSLDNPEDCSTLVSKSQSFPQRLLQTRSSVIRCVFSVCLDAFDPVPFTIKKQSLLTGFIHGGHLLTWGRVSFYKQNTHKSGQPGGWGWECTGP